MKTLVGLILSLLLALPAAAQQQHRYVENCRQLCNAPAREISANPPAVQACMIRCQAGNDFNTTGTRGTNAGTGRAVAGAGGQSGSWGVIYAATPPNGATGVSQGLADRSQAHLEANRACAAQAGANCRVLAEAGPGQCVSAVQAGHNVGLIRTSDPRTFQVTMVEHGQGTTQAAADAEALRNCNGRGSCEVVARACGSR